MGGSFMVPGENTRAYDPLTLSHEAFFALNSITYALLLLHALEWAQHLPVEARYMFRRTWRSPLKWLYVFSRCFGILVQMCNVFFANFSQKIGPLPSGTCRMWLSFQLFAGQSLWSALEYSLVTRLTALYHESSWELSLLRYAVYFEKVVNIVGGCMSIPLTTVTDQCITTNTPPGVAFTQAVTAALLLLIWFLTYRKRSKARTSLVFLVFRDGSRAIAAVFVMLSAIILNAKFSIAGSPPPWWNSTFFYQCSFPIIIAILTSANCRMIKNLEGFGRFSENETQSYSSSIELAPYTELPDQEDSYEETA